MKVYSNYCRRDKCCICVREGRCLSVSGDYFTLANKETINDRLTRLSGRYRVQDISLMRFVLDKMEQEEKETKEKEMMAISIKTVDVEKEKEAAREEGYEAGLEEAYDLIKRLYYDNNLPENLFDLFPIPGYSLSGIPNILKYYSIHEVKEKIAAYEAEQTKPKLGDVIKCKSTVYDTSYIGIVISKDSDSYSLLCIDSKRTCIFTLKNEYWTIEKTGKNFDIQSILDALEQAVKE